MKKLLYTRITEKTIALFLFAFLLLSRASITTTVNFVPLNTTVVQVAYSGCMHLRKSRGMKSLARFIYQRFFRFFLLSI